MIGVTRAAVTNINSLRKASTIEAAMLDGIPTLPCLVYPTEAGSELQKIMECCLAFDPEQRPSCDRSDSASHGAVHWPAAPQFSSLLLFTGETGTCQCW